MKVYSCPEQITWEEPDYANYDIEKEEAREKAHEAQLRQWLVENGAAGPRTGEILRSLVGDGFARYMYADGKPAYLVHLPYGYYDQNVQFLPKKEVLRRLDLEKRRQAFFDRPREETEAA